MAVKAKVKAKPEKVKVLRFGRDRSVKLQKAVKLKNDVLLYDKYAYLRRYGANDGFSIYIRNRLRRDGDNKLKVDEVYEDYFKFCNEYDLPILPVEKFIDKLSMYVTVNDGHVEGIAFDDKRININASDVYLFENGFRKTPVYVVIEGVPKTITFDELKAYALNGDDEIVTFDDETLASVVSESVTMGATLGTQKLFWDIKVLILVCLVLCIISLYFSFQNQLMLDKVVKMLSKML